MYKSSQVCNRCAIQLLVTRHSLNSKPPSGQVFPMLCGGENGQPPTQRAKGALILATIKLTCLITPTTDLKASLLSQCHLTTPPKTTQTLNFKLYQTSHHIYIHPIDHLVETGRKILPMCLVTVWTLGKCGQMPPSVAKRK